MHGVNIQVISVTQSGDSSVRLEFYVSTPDGVLTATSLQSATEAANTQLQSEFGVTLHCVSTAPSEESETTNGVIAGWMIGVMVALLVVLIIPAIIIAYCVGYVCSAYTYNRLCIIIANAMTIPTVYTWYTHTHVPCNYFTGGNVLEELLELRSILLASTPDMGLLT